MPNPDDLLSPIRFCIRGKTKEVLFWKKKAELWGFRTEIRNVVECLDYCEVVCHDVETIIIADLFADAFGLMRVRKAGAYYERKL